MVHRKSALVLLLRLDRNAVSTAAHAYAYAYLRHCEEQGYLIFANWDTQSERVLTSSTVWPLGSRQVVCRLVTYQKHACVPIDLAVKDHFKTVQTRSYHRELKHQPQRTIYLTSTSVPLHFSLHPLSRADTWNGQTCDFVAYESKLEKSFFFYPITVNAIDLFHDGDQIKYPFALMLRSPSI